MHERPTQKPTETGEISEKYRGKLLQFIAALRQRLAEKKVSGVRDKWQEFLHEKVAKMMLQADLRWQDAMKKSGEALPKELELDTVFLRKINGDQVFVGQIFYYSLKNNELKLISRHYNAIKDQPLPPFFYKKPIINDLANLKEVFSPEEIWEGEEKIRKNYYPLAIVENALRGPHHWHRSGAGLFCAVQDNEGNWSTRYFPEDNLDPEIWKIAKQMLSSHQ